ncbi:single-stranded-DNA-specific exonuclease RecJ [Salinibacillus xinjiangensis]|uniref:Single-stranded-DNA-specific exonuclease RecJ n=1 Tax=Salinibacillus xinjiangensis TaxID=1229268 RepID=A0A6G1XBH7_9BACI|nr:single-stranded-DNA-specific exonuclease RecJ [Salinibacillus xinjiangensis]MRG88256.1 single-stranded-DNA-specific exonuclease RecJ [Salinibacillus xinjiangensis]
MLESKALWKSNRQQEIECDIDLPISNVTKDLLLQRGIRDTNTAKKFLSPSLEDLHDPFLFSDMKKVKDRVERAIEANERILVFGDYDADGVTSTTLLVESLREKGAVVDFYIPNRFTEGYGPNEAAFRQAKDAGVSLILTVDTGIAAVDEAKVAKDLDMDLIITDHHEQQEILPDAYAIIHPKLCEDYPFDELAGVGVAFKVAHALLGTLPKHFLELAAIGTVADLVPLKDENRVMVAHGLQFLTSSQRPGIQMLKEVCGITGEVSEENIGFGIGPRLNAVGRLQDASLAVELLLERDIDQAREFAAQVQQLNQKRQQLVTEIANEAKKMIQEQEMEQDAVLVVAKKDWNPGVLGIVASRLGNMYHKPAIVLGIDSEKGEAKGSARSIDAFNLFENCMEIKHLFIAFGGHSQAAGMTVGVDKIDELRTAINKLANDKLTEADFQPVLSIDQKVELEDISLETIKEIEQLAPFGMANPKPLFQIDEQTPSEIRLIGSKENHLKMNFQRESVSLDAIGFGMGDLFPKIAPQSALSLVGELGINEWNGRKKLQIMLKDVKVNEWQLFDFRGLKHVAKQIKGLDMKEHVGLYFGDSTLVEPWAFEQFSCVHIDEWQEHEWDKVSGLWLLDLPSSLQELSDVLSQIKPKNIYAYFKTNQQNFFSQVPTRSHFKTFYGMMMKRGKLDLNQEKNSFAKSRGWSLDFLDFIIKVFLELQFVKIEDRVLHYVTKPAKRDLTESATYQLKLSQIEVEKTLYFSTYKELKNWIDGHIQVSQLKEEVIHGL